MAGRQTATNPLAGLQALAQLGEVLTALQGAPSKTSSKKEFVGGREGYRSVAVVSVEEAKAIVKAATSKEDQTVVVGNRETIIEVLGDEAAAKFKGGFRIHRRTLPTA